MNARREIARLKGEVDVLQEQVKRLVRAEHRLSEAQRFLDRELQKVEALTKFDLIAAQATSVEDILQHALSLITTLFSMEQGLAFHVNKEGVFKLKLALCPSDSDSAGRINEQIFFPFERGEIPQGPWVGRSGAMNFASPERLFALIDSVAAQKPKALRRVELAECKVMYLPIMGKNDDVQVILILGCMEKEPTLFDTFPQVSDLPFLRLFCAHIGMGLQNFNAFQEVSEAVQVRDDFISIASHELKTPLTSILLSVELLKRQLLGNQSAVSKVQKLEKHCRRQEALLSQLLDVGRIRAGRLESKIAEIDCVLLLREVCSKYVEELNASGSSLLLDLPASMVLFADPSQLEQVISNLISNAIKYGAGRPISLRLRRHENMARIRIRDHGLGISAADRERVFNRFERAVSSRHYGGLGLGLYISSRIVESHRGSLYVKSKPERGSIFVVELPLLQELPKAFDMSKEAMGPRFADQVIFRDALPRKVS